ncbi:DNA polymerase III subunit delta' [Shewanella avicenniae]|uniref:DNA-directed DNA polymerase n=1 Tax=Shewanella avicenniae TaxID=2814294 RepID=A0ABX7QL44_9GAMM|nr:DNA polymerase III subunit delta' [Shewanella avicenniae]QSX32174.1 DNA polymerase III subunit delta' [Shewanella avicenniae]
MSSLPWINSALQQLQQQQQQQRLAHALLLPLAVADGGLLLAHEIVANCLCDNHTNPACGQCRACRLLAAGNHPDVYWLKAEGNQIKVEQVRELCQSLAATAQQGGYRIAVIQQSERMNQAAANALLKTLEEPGRNTLLLLQTDIAGGLLPTITSRCQRVNVQPPSLNDVAAWLQPLTLSIADLAWSLPVVGGAIALKEALQSERFNQLQQFKTWVEQSFSTGHLVQQLSDVKEDNIFDVLKLVYHVLLEQLKNTAVEPFVCAKIAELAQRVMQDSRQLMQMPTVNYLAILQSYVIEYKRLK